MGPANGVSSFTWAHLHHCHHHYCHHHHRHCHHRCQHPIYYYYCLYIMLFIMIKKKMKKKQTIPRICLSLPRLPSSPITMSTIFIIYIIIIIFAPDFIPLFLFFSPCTGAICEREQARQAAVGRRRHRLSRPSRPCHETGAPPVYCCSGGTRVYSWRTRGLR